MIKNYWGLADDVRVGIEWVPFEDQSKATIIEDVIEIGSISDYATYQDLNESLKITLSDDIGDNSIIRFNLSVWIGENQEYLSENIELNITTTNTILIGGFYNTDLILYPGNKYLLSGGLIFENASLIMMPGVTLEVESNSITWLDGNIGNVYAVGTKDLPITITPRNGVTNSLFTVNGMSQSRFEYCIFDRTSFQSSEVSYQNSDGAYVLDAIIKHCRFVNSTITTTDNGTMYGRYPYVSYSNIKQAGGGYYYDNRLYINYINDRGLWEYNNFMEGTHGSYRQYRNNYFSNFHTVIALNTLPGLSSRTPQESTQTMIGGFYGNTYTDFENVYIGTSSIEVLGEITLDALDNGASQGIFNFENAKLSPFEEAHGMVWKIEVNGINSFDNYITMFNNPIGVGSHEFKVYFNRAMDTSVDPIILYGPAYPYTSRSVSETGTWSSDGKVYTVNHDINIGAADGLNRFYIYGARDLDYFDIPHEFQRFNVLIQSAGSASLGWYATPGLGKIALTWEAPSAEEIDDALGYNMYRYQVDADGVESDPVKLNESLIIEDTDESTTGVYYSDFNVVEGQTYFYKYNILRTSFETTDYSSVVSTAPLTSTLGDSNGDFSVNVMDLVHDVDYILGNNPTPFIFLAGDVNADLAINVLDIVGTVDIILNPSTTSDSSVGSNRIQFYPSEAIGNANFTWEGNDLYVASDHTIGGIQLAFNTDFEYVLSEDLPTIEHLDYTQEDSKILMLYSFNNTMIASSKTKILTRIDASQEFDIEQAVVGTTTGAKLNATLNNGTLSTIDAPFQNNNLQFLNLFPNPTQGLVNLEYYLPNQMDQVVAKVYDMLGRLVHIQLLENRAGISKIPMELSRLKTGNYIVLITANKGGSIKNIANKKLIVK